ncbi:MAG: RDD family protein [Rickettsiales bacterium]|nr:RDD family protein [Rickettsiales bacterium]
MKINLKQYITSWSDESALAASGARYAGFWRRVAATTIDMMWFSPLYVMMLWQLGDNSTEIVFILIGLLFYVLAFSSRWQATPGMRLCRVYVVNTSNQRLPPAQSLWWGITSFFGVLVCFAGLFYLETIVDVNAINNLLLTNMDVLYEAQQGIIDPRLSELLNGMDYDAYQRLSQVALYATIALLVLWSLAIALPKNKAGFHNWLCKTRFLIGTCD